MNIHNVHCPVLGNYKLDTLPGTYCPVLWSYELNARFCPGQLWNRHFLQLWAAMNWTQCPVLDSCKRGALSIPRHLCPVLGSGHTDTVINLSVKAFFLNLGTEYRLFVLNIHACRTWPLYMCYLFIWTGHTVLGRYKVDALTQSQIS